MRVVQAPLSTVTWSDDGGLITKRFPDRSHRRRFDAERRINLILARRTTLVGPASAPRLIGCDRRRLELHFAAIDGEPLGPKFPTELRERDVDRLIDLALSLSSVRVGTGRLRRMAPTVVLSSDERSLMRRWIRDSPPRWVFGHGDITARNVLRDSHDAFVLIDWEWAGLYPRGWDLAFLWFSLIDVPGARDQVAASVPRGDAPWFWRSALLVTMLHLRLPSMVSPFRERHEATRDDLMRRHEIQCR